MLRLPEKAAAAKKFKEALSSCTLFRYPWFYGPIVQRPIVPLSHCAMVPASIVPLSTVPLYCRIARLFHGPWSHYPIAHGPVFPLSHCVSAPLCKCLFVILPQWLSPNRPMVALP